MMEIELSKLAKDHELPRLEPIIIGENIYFVEHRTDDYIVMVASYYADATFEWKGGDYDKHD